MLAPLREPPPYGAAHDPSFLETAARALIRGHAHDGAAAERASARGLVNRLVQLLALKERETVAHYERLALYADALAERLGVPESESTLIAIGTQIHDIGKLGLPDDVLRKEGPLADGEWDIIRTHPDRGANFFDEDVSPLCRIAKEISWCHHEKWNGTGYPRGLAGSSIPLSARIAAIADQYDALRGARPYKEAFSHRRACETIVSGDGRTRPQHFDPVVLEAFESAHAEFESIFVALPDARRGVSRPEWLAGARRQRFGSPSDPARCGGEWVRR